MEFMLEGWENHPNENEGYMLKGMLLGRGRETENTDEQRRIRVGRQEKRQAGLRNL